jgi:muramoyltetrapeptide carboxypeptidase
MRKKSWSFLVPGDVVDIIAPASYSPQEKFDDGIDWLKHIGLNPRVPNDIIKPDLFFAAPLEIQFQHLKDALYSDSKAIWCLRGGYGSMRLIPELLKLKPPKKPKLFVGFSDITSLHLFLSQNWGWPVIHGRTISQLSVALQQTKDRAFLKDLVFGQEESKTFKNLIPLNKYAVQVKSLTGMITGGNLRIIQSSLGTPWEIKPRGKILFIEDVSERGYSLDRMFEQLIQAKLLNNKVKAIIFGDFTDGKEKNGNDLTKDALLRFASRVPYPVLMGFPAGHGEINFPVPFNVNCQLSLGKKASITCNYGGHF